jgi:hypothetical protein
MTLTYVIVRGSEMLNIDHNSETFHIVCSKGVNLMIDL